jgi:hypothetical protein
MEVQNAHRTGATMPTLVKLTLSESLAREAEANGLLAPESIERLLQEEVRSGASTGSLRPPTDLAHAPGLR